MAYRELAERDTFSLDDVISYMEATPDESWNVDTVRSSDGARNCFFGHLFNMGKDEDESNDIWRWFESYWSTTYVIYRINDGSHERYPEETAKQRVIAYLKNLRSGVELDTMASMEEDYQNSLRIHGRSDI